MGRKQFLGLLVFGDFPIQLLRPSTQCQRPARHYRLALKWRWSRFRAASRAVNGRQRRGLWSCAHSKDYTRGALGVLAIPATPDDMVLPVDVLGVLGHGLQIKGISEGDVDPQTFIPLLIDLYLEGKFPFDKLISSYPLDEINQAVEDQLNGICVKPVLTP